MTGPEAQAGASQADDVVGAKVLLHQVLQTHKGNEITKNAPTNFFFTFSTCILTTSFDRAWNAAAAGVTREVSSSSTKVKLRRETLRPPTSRQSRPYSYEGDRRWRVLIQYVRKSRTAPFLWYLSKLVVHDESWIYEDVGEVAEALLGLVGLKTKIRLPMHLTEINFLNACNAE